MGFGPIVAILEMGYLSRPPPFFRWDSVVKDALQPPVMDDPSPDEPARTVHGGGPEDRSAILSFVVSVRLSSSSEALFQSVRKALPACPRPWS